MFRELRKTEALGGFHVGSESSRIFEVSGAGKMMERGRFMIVLATLILCLLGKAAGEGLDYGVMLGATESELVGNVVSQVPA